MSTGSLGQGISSAVGMAIGAKLQKKDFKVYTILGDGELQEGQVWEAAMFAGAKKLNNLVVIIDNNNLQIDGYINEVNSPYPIKEKFESFNFEVFEIDGHSFSEIEEVFKKIDFNGSKPYAIVLKTTKGKGVSFMEDKAEWHGSAPNDEQFNTAMSELE